MPTSHKQLIERLRSADGPSRELDLLVWTLKEGAKLRHYTLEPYDQCKTEVRAEYDNDDWRVVGYAMSDCTGSEISVYHGFQDELPHYTSSLDAALALAGEFPKVRLQQLHFGKEAGALMWPSDPTTKPWRPYYGDHESPAIAVLIALLKALTALDAEAG